MQRDDQVRLRHMLEAAKEIWLINLDPTDGSEMRKTRPAAIVSNDAIGVLPLKVVVPLNEFNEETFSF